MVNLKIGEIDLKKEPANPILYLCKPNGTIISILNEAFDITLDIGLGRLHELRFKIPLYKEIHHKLVENDNYHKIKGRFHLKLKLGIIEEIFVITNLDKVDKKKKYLEVESLSLGIELNDSIIRGYEVISYTAKEILEDLLEDTIWSVGYIDSEFLMKYRKMEIASSTVLEAVFDTAKTFNALVVFNSKNRTVNFYRPENFGVDKGFSISYEKYLDGMNHKEKSEEIITRLYLYGKEDISIHDVNPAGQPYIEDFTYYIYPYKENRNYSNESFTGTQIKNNWGVVGLGSDWIITGDNSLRLNSNSASMNIIYNKNKMNAKNVKISATFKPTSEQNEFGIVFNFIDNLNYYYLSYLSNQTQSNNLKIYKVRNGVKTEIANSNKVLGWSVNQKYNISIECDNKLIKAWINDVLLISHINSEEHIGSYGFYGFAQTFEVSNINVYYYDYTIIEHSDYMSDELCHHILKYDDFLKENEQTFKNLRNQRMVHVNHKSILDKELFDLETELKILKDERDMLNTRIAKKEDEIDSADNRYLPKDNLINERDDLVFQRNQKNIEISIKENEIINKKNEIVKVESMLDDVDNKIRLFRIKIDIQNHFPDWILKERKKFTISKEWQDNNIENSEDLLNEGKKVFDEYRQEKIELKIELVNFLSMVTEQRNWDKLGIGDTFEIEHERMGIKYKAKITEIKFDFEKKKIEVTISNLKDLYSNKSKYLEMLYKSYSSSTKVSIKEWEWDLARESNGKINDLINSIWDANKNAILGAKDQVIEISDRGLIIRDPNNPNVYLVGLNSMIAITNDGGNTWKHAITSEGIVGDVVTSGNILIDNDFNI